MAEGLLPTGEEWTVSIENVLCGDTGVTCTKSININIGGVKLHLIRGNNHKYGSTKLSENVYVKDGVMISTDAHFFVHVLKIDWGLSVVWDRGMYTWPRGHKTFFMLNSTEQEISTAHKN